MNQLASTAPQRLWDRLPTDLVNHIIKFNEKSLGLFIRYNDEVLIVKALSYDRYDIKVVVDEVSRGPTGWQMPDSAIVSRELLKDSILYFLCHSHIPEQITSTMVEELDIHSINIGPISFDNDMDYIFDVYDTEEWFQSYVRICTMLDKIVSFLGNVFE